MKSGRDSEAGALLEEWELRANEATRVIFDTGLFCYWLKSELGRGQFGPWLEAHAPKLARRDEHNIVKPTSTLSWHMDFTKRLIESGGFTIERVLKQLPGSAEMRKPELYMLLPEKKVPAGLRDLHIQIADKFSGKTAYQLYLELKQADEAGNVKRGRLKGCKGTTRHQREAARLRQEQLDIEEASDDTDELTRLMGERCDGACVGKAGPDSRIAFIKALIVANAFAATLPEYAVVTKGAKR